MSGASGARSGILPLLASAVLGAAVGGSGVWLAMRPSPEAAPSEAAPPRYAQVPAPRLEPPPAPPAPPPRRAVQLEPVRDAEPAPRPERAPPDPLERFRERAARWQSYEDSDDEETEEPEPLPPLAREFLNDRTRAAALAFVDAADFALEAFGTEAEEDALRELSTRRRNATYYATPELKAPVKRFYEATKAYRAGDEADLEWRQARSELLDAIDAVFHY